MIVKLPALTKNVGLSVSVVYESEVASVEDYVNWRGGKNWDRERVREEKK